MKCTHKDKKFIRWEFINFIGYYVCEKCGMLTYVVDKKQKINSRKLAVISK